MPAGDGAPGPVKASCLGLVGPKGFQLCLQAVHGLNQPVGQIGGAKGLWKRCVIDEALYLLKEGFAVLSGIVEDGNLGPVAQLTENALMDLAIHARTARTPAACGYDELRALFGHLDVGAQHHLEGETEKFWRILGAKIHRPGSGPGRHDDLMAHQLQHLLIAGDTTHVGERNFHIRSHSSCAAFCGSAYPLRPPCGSADDSHRNAHPPEWS